MRANFDFEITGWDDETYDAPAEGLPLVRATIEKAFKGGDLTGTSSAQMLACGEEAYAVIERVTGQLGGRQGTFVMRHGGMSDADGNPTSFLDIVPNSGTGGLSGIRGSGTVAHGRFTVDYELPDAA